MTSDRLPRWFSALQTHPVRVAVVLVAALLLSALGLLRVSLDPSLTLMLPENSEILDTITFLRDTEFSGRVVLSLRRKDAAISQGEFLRTVDELADSLDSPLIDRVITGFKQEQAIQEMGKFFEQAPELIDEQDLAAIEGQLTEKQIARVLRRKFIELLKPQGAFMLAAIRSDPLEIRMGILYRMRELATSFGYDLRVEDGHILSRSGDHAMLLVQTSVEFTDAEESKQLLAFLEERRQQLPEWAELDVVSGHQHTVSNEQIIKRDIRVTMTIVTIAFVLLFGLYVRDVRAGLVFAVPMLAVVGAISICAVVLRVLSPMAVGFGSVIAGIAVDYGIHVYIAVRRSANAAAAVRKVARPVVLGALTTSGVFVAFLFSAIPGYRQLAWLALVSIVLSVASALLLLPAFIKADSAQNPGNWRPPEWSPRQAIIVTIAALLCFGAMLPSIWHSRFESDMALMDGTEKKFIDQERRFQEVWGQGDTGQAMIVVSGGDTEAALRANDWLYREMTERLPEAKVVSFSRIWKSAEHRSRNLQRWREFWRTQRIEELRSHMVKAGAEYGFTEDAFAPFLEQLAKPPAQPGELPKDRGILSELQQRFIQRRGDGVYAFTYFPDTEANLKLLESIPRDQYQPTVISRSYISQTLTRDYTREITRVVILACILVIGSCALLLRDTRMTLVSMVPVVFGVISIVAIATLLDRALTVVDAFAAIVVIGLCIDYGIFAVHSYAYDLRVGTWSAITLSAGTTMIGSAALMFAHHRALYSIGLTLLSGMAGGYVASLVVVPALCELWVRRTDEQPA